MSGAKNGVPGESLRRLKPYTAYKGSDVEWLGELPAHWTHLPLGRLGRFSASGIDKKTIDGERKVLMINYTDVYSNQTKTLDASHEYMQTTCPSWKASEHELCRGDLLFTPSSETQAEVGFSAVVTEDMPGTVYSYHLIRLRPDRRIGLDIGFSKYLCNNSNVLSQFSAVSKGTTRQILTREDFRTVVAPLPPVPEQRAIATFLDRETARIDALVAKKERLIELLQEQRTALITRAVTKGLDPTVPMKDSGVEWLGEIPSHWEAHRLKSIAAVQLSNVDKKSVEGQEPVQLCNYTDVYYNERITADMDFMAATATLHQVRRFSLRKDDVLITKDSESWTDIAVPAVVAEDLADVLCGYHLAHIRPEEGCHGPFLARAFSAIGPRDQFQVAANGITRFGLGGDAIASGVFAMPPEPEQRAIAAFLDRQTARIDALVAKVREAIDCLKELRTALISAAVTGKIDVREEAA